jgi:hypothetical protein
MTGAKVRVTANAGAIQKRLRIESSLNMVTAASSVSGSRVPLAAHASASDSANAGTSATNFSMKRFKCANKKAV